ncbi:hypothetical protein CONCODRAFT_24392, partial [Conidiobolus coronatus NRRL 28638]
YPIYNTILVIAFPPVENYIVAPQTYPKDSKESIEFSIEYDLIVTNKLVGFMEIKPEYDYDNISSRLNADTQMRKRFAQL